MSLMTYIVLAVALYIAQLVIQALVSIPQYGVGPLVGARDTMAEPAPVLGRIKRANQNMVEALVMFTPVALLAVHTGALEATLGAAIFFYARLFFFPLYVFGVPWIRTLVWFAGVAGVIMIILKLLPLI